MAILPRSRFYMRIAPVFDGDLYNPTYGTWGGQLNVVGLHFCPAILVTFRWLIEVGGWSGGGAVH